MSRLRTPPSPQLKEVLIKRGISGNISLKEVLINSPVKVMKVARGVLTPRRWRWGWKEYCGGRAG